MASVMSSRVLTATCRRITVSTARYTTPIPPFASTSLSSYRPFNLVDAVISSSNLALFSHRGRFQAEIVTLAIVSLGRLRGTNQKKHVLACLDARRGQPI